MADMSEMNKLVKLLAENGVPFEIKAFTTIKHDIKFEDLEKHPLDVVEATWQIRSPSTEYTKIDAICHSGSYGYKEGLIEIMVCEPFDDVIGWLTAEEALPYFIGAMDKKE